MAKREDEFDLDFGDFDNFDFGDPFDDGAVPKDDRKPSTKFVGGFLKGVQDTAKKPSTYVDFMRKALPEGYSAAYDVVDDVTGKGIGLYNEVVTDLRPAMRDLKRLLYRTKTAVDSVLPDSLSKKLDGWLKEKEQEARSDVNYDPNELKIASDLAEIFKVQAEAKAEDDKKGLLEQAVDSKRHRTQTEQLDDVRVSLKQLTSYQDNITYAYQKKSLELQYRQYYAQRDLLEVSKANTQESVSLLRVIQKNTALPDILKTHDTELMGRLTKERLYGVVQDRIAPFAREFLNPFFQNISKRIKEKTTEFTDIVSMVAMGADSAAEAGDLLEEFGESKEGVVGKELGSAGTSWLARYLGKKLRPQFEKRPGIVAGGYKAGYLAENYDLLLKEQLEEYNPTNPIMQMLQESALEALRVRAGTKVGYDDISRATERVSWDNLSRKSLVEIIPGFLARILQSSEGIRTGGNAPLLTYDNKTNRFITTKALAGNIRTQAIDRYNVERIAKRSEEVIDKMDPTGSLDPETRKKLQLHLIKQAQNNKGFTTKAYTDDYELMQAGFNAEESEQIADIIRNTLDADFEGNMAFTPDAQKSRRDIARDIRSLRELIPSIYEFANINANTGNREAVRLAGITQDMRGEDHVNKKFLIERVQQYLKGEFDENAAGEVFADSSGIPTVGGGRRRASYTRDNTNAVMEAFSAAQKANASVLEQIQETLQKGNVGFDSKSDFDRIIEVLRAESVKEQSIDASKTLREILEIVDEIRTHGVIASGGAMSDDNSPEARNWKRLRGFGRGIKGMGAALLKPVKGLWGLGGGLSSTVHGAIGTSWNAAKNIGSALFSPIREKFQDVYVPGFAQPKLKAHLMSAGEYLDQKTGKVINSIRDIKGVVVDKAGNVVLDLDDIKKGLMTADGKPIGARLLSNMSAMGLNALGWAKDQLGKGFTLPFSITSQAFTAVKNTLRKSPDVYVMGEGSPRLKGSLLRAGHYISAKTRKPIFSVEDIDGDVLDGTTGEVILSAVDAAKGLVDRWGKPIRTLLGKLVDLGRKGLGVGLAAGKWGVGQLLKGFGTVKDIVAGGFQGFKNALGGVHIGGVKMDPVVSSVDRIYDLLVKYFASKGMSEADIEAEGIFDPQSGDVDLPNRPEKTKRRTISEMVSDKAEALKNRAGSWWNLRQKKDDGPKADKKERTKEGEKKGNNWLTTLLLGLGSLGGSVVNAIKWLGGVIAAKSAIGAAGDLAGLGDGIDGPDRKKGGKGGRGPKGKAGLLRKLAGGLGTVAWTGLKWAGRAALVAGAGALNVGAALASAVSLPVVLTVAAVAAVGYAGYKAYRYYKDRLAPLQRLRFSQYGIPLDNLEKCTIVGQLEMDVVKNVIWSDGKAINIDSRFDVLSQLERFGVDKNSKRQVADFANWYQNRFKPVYLTHLTVLSKLSPGTSLQESDSIPDYLKVTYARATRFGPEAAEQPYNVSTSPFPDVKLVEGREIIDQEVVKVIEDNKRAVRPDSKRNAEASSKTPAVTRQMPTAQNPSGIADPEKRNEFVTAAGAPKTPLMSLLNPSSTNTTLDPNRKDFVTGITAAETAADLSKEQDREKVGDQPRSNLYNEIPNPVGNGSWDAVKDTLIAVASALGIDVKKLATLARLESSFNINAKAKTSSAKGLFQFIASTWRGMMDKFAGVFGIPRDAQPTDPKAAAIMAGQFLKMNEQALESKLGRKPDLTESYLAHFLGAEGSKTLLGAGEDKFAADVLPKAAAANRSIFFKPDGSPRTIAEVIEVMRNKVEGGAPLPASIPNELVKSTGEVVSISDTTTQPDGTFDDGRANRSALVQRSASNGSILNNALPTRPESLPKSTTTAYNTYSAARNDEPTALEMEQKEQQRQEYRKRQLEKQQQSIAESQREDMNAAVSLAKESLLVQRSMDESLRNALVHLRNLENLAKAEKPDVKTETVPTVSTRPSVTPVPVAKLSMARKSI